MRPTTKRLARIACIGVAVLAVVVLWLLLHTPASHSPLIQGKPLAYWTRQLSLSPLDQDAIDALASEKAVAMPALVKQLLLPDSRIVDAVKGLWGRLPAPLRDRIPKPTTRAELRAEAGNALMRVYGTKAPQNEDVSARRDAAPSATEAK